MEEAKFIRSYPIFQNQPIICPWVTSQPYPSTQGIKNKLNEFAKNHDSSLNISSKRSTTDPILSNPISASPVQQSSTHFFYFLRLMQLFPDTHPATLHTVLTLSKNNFFYAIDKLLYAKKCKNIVYGKRSQPYRSTRGRGGHLNGRGRPQRASNETVVRPDSDDLAEVQKIIGIAEKNYIEVDQIPSAGENREANSLQAVNITVENALDQTNEITHHEDITSFGDQEVIEIVCFQNEVEQEPSHMEIGEETVEEVHTFPGDIVADDTDLV